MFRSEMYTKGVWSDFEESALEFVDSLLGQAKVIAEEAWFLKTDTVTNDTPESRTPFKQRTKSYVGVTVKIENLIRDLIENYWQLVPEFKYYLKYVGNIQEETSRFYHFEAIFSQPSPKCPIPQTTVSVFFRVELKNVFDDDTNEPFRMVFRLEGQQSDLDFHSVRLISDWIHSIMVMKLNVFKRIEALGIF